MARALAVVALVAAAVAIVVVVTSSIDGKDGGGKKKKDGASGWRAATGGRGRGGSRLLHRPGGRSPQPDRAADLRAGGRDHPAQPGGRSAGAHTRAVREPGRARMRAARVALAAAIVLLVASPAAGAASREPQPAAEAWVLIDARDGERLAADDAATERSIASATKLMTAYLALREKNLDKRVAAPAYQPAAAAESLLGLEAGERVSYRELVYSLILASANDGAVAVAEGVSGSVDALRPRDERRRRRSRSRRDRLREPDRARRARQLLDRDRSGRADLRPARGSILQARRRYTEHTVRDRSRHPPDRHPRRPAHPGALGDGREDGLHDRGRQRPGRLRRAKGRPA